MPHSKIDRALRRSGTAGTHRASPSALRLMSAPADPPAIRELRQCQSAAARSLAREVELVASHAFAPVLIEGETGTGKTHIAQALHELSPRTAEPFVKRDLTTIRPDFAVSELFGHHKGSFTGSTGERVGAFLEANCGTLFLDELGKCSLELQGMLLNSIEYGECRLLGSERAVIVDVRVIAASNLPLESQVADGEFLLDLYARFSGWTLQVPPLRERRADIPLLVAATLGRLAHRDALPRAPAVDDDLMRAFVEYDWPFNLRELSQTLDRLMLESRGDATLRLAHVPRRMALRAMTRRQGRRRTDAEKDAAIVAAGGDVDLAAKSLGINRSTLFRHAGRRRQVTQTVEDSSN